MPATPDTIKVSIQQLFAVADQLDPARRSAMLGLVVRLALLLHETREQRVELVAELAAELGIDKTTRH
jgi:hypothetical protein